IGDYISASQVGVTLVSIAIGAVGEPAVAHALEKIFPAAVSHGIAVVISATVAYLLITSAHIVAGELVPKFYVIQHAEGVARRIARPFRFCRRLFAPFTAVLTTISEWILRRLGVDPEASTDEAGTPEELKPTMAEGPQATIESIVTEAPIVPETKPLDDLLADLQRQRTSLAVVIDEYGRVAGIVTVEDIIEEVVGEIDDETDPAAGEVRRLAN